MRKNAANLLLASIRPKNWHVVVLSHQFARLDYKNMSTKVIPIKRLSIHLKSITRRNCMWFDLPLVITTLLKVAHRFFFIVVKYSAFYTFSA